MNTRILVPVSGPSSLEAVDRALQIAAANAGLVTAVGLDGYWPVGVVRVSAPDISIVRRRDAVADAGREARSRAVESGVDLEFVSREGSSTDAIVDEARRCRADLIVVEEAMPWLARWARRGGARHLRRLTGREVLVVGRQGGASAAEASRLSAA